jgi:hypothetical protein
MESRKIEEARGRSGDVKVKEEGERGGVESRAEEGERKMEESGKEEDMDMASVLFGWKVDFTGREGRAQGNNGIIMGGKEVSSVDVAGITAILSWHARDAPRMLTLYRARGADKKPGGWREMRNDD